MKKKASTNVVRMWSGPDFQSAWENLLLPWLRQARQAGSPPGQPSLIVTPHRAYADQMREALVRARQPLLGVRFVNPPQLRELLSREQGEVVPLREHLRLLLAISANEAASLHANEDDLTPRNIAIAVSRDPDGLLRTIDRLDAAGWPTDELDSPTLREIAKNFGAMCSKCGFELIAQRDRQLFNASKRPLFSRILISGFDGKHWPLWMLLRAAVLRSGEATIHHTDPREDGREADELWIGTWEETFGPAQPIPSAVRAVESMCRTQFFVARNVSAEAALVRALTLQCLAEQADARIGIIVPDAGALPRRISAALARADIPHHDAIGFRESTRPEESAWRRWIDLQRDPRCRTLIHFLRASKSAVGKFGGLELRTIESAIRRAYDALLIDDLAVVREWCARGLPPEQVEGLADGLRSVEFLPATASFADFLAQAIKTCRAFDWREREDILRESQSDWTTSVAAQFPAALFLRWLMEVTAASESARSSLGDHPYARVHILLAEQAEGQEWSHAIFAGLNEGNAVHDSGFLSERIIAALNNRAVRSGGQGEGHRCVSDGHALLLGEGARLQFRSRAMSAIAETTTHLVALTAHRYDEQNPTRTTNPNAQFARRYFEETGEVLARAAIDALAERTTQFLRDFPCESSDSRNEIEAMHRAYRARRRIETNFSPYEFALITPVSEPITLSATEWQKVFTCPALVWMRVFLGVRAANDELTNWNIATGKWVHAWLASLVNSCELVAFPRHGDHCARVREAALKTRASAEAILTAANRQFPDWWISGFTRAAYLAHCLSGKLQGADDWGYAAAELSLHGKEVPTHGYPALRTRGRIDLLLAKSANALRQKTIPLWVVDYKTGNYKALPTSGNRAEALRKMLLKGEGVQICVYALALHGRGASEVSASILSRSTDDLVPQIGLEEIVAQEPIWTELAQMAETGHFGMRGALRSEFNFTDDYPIATLAIDPDTLEQKWESAHPGLAEIFSASAQ